MAEGSAERMPTQPTSGCLQAFLALIVGGTTYSVLSFTDPFGVCSFLIPQGSDGEQIASAYARWKSSPGVIIGQSAMNLIPLLVSGLCGVFIHNRTPDSIPVALLRMVGVASMLFVASWVGSWAINRALSTGESSDILTPLAVLGFEFSCMAVAAPLTATVIRRRSPRIGLGPSIA